MFYSDPSDLENLNWEEIDSRKWTSVTDELKHQKMAELLVHGSLPWSCLARIVVWDESIATHVRKICVKLGVECPTIDFNSKSIHYYTKFPLAPDKSLVTGPFCTKLQYQSTVDRVLRQLGRAPKPKFRKLRLLRDGLRADISCIPETAELVGLTSENSMHSQDLGQHTEQVAKNLRNLPEFKRLDLFNQMLVEIAAYFHDIGKGPKSRWATKQGQYKNDKDHPVDAMPMVARILTEEVATMLNRSAEVILKLVCYHDLIGDIVGHGRIEQQLFDIINDEEELDMLIALSKADTTAVQDSWWNESAVNRLRQRAVESLKNTTHEDGDTGEA